jgi:hypothetical protein
MKTYSFIITTTVSQKISCKAESLEKAREIADNYTYNVDFEKDQGFDVEEEGMNSTPIEDNEGYGVHVVLDDEESAGYLNSEEDK